MITLNVTNRVEVEEARGHHLKVAPQCQELATLNVEIVDKLGILTILACEGIRHLKYRDVNLHRAVVFEDLTYDR